MGALWDLGEIIESTEWTTSSVHQPTNQMTPIIIEWLNLFTQPTEKEKY